MSRVRTVKCEYQPYCLYPPQSSEEMRNQSTRNDDSTINHWHDVWIRNFKANHDYVGGFAKGGLIDLYGKFLHRPVIIAGSGPSLKYSVEGLKNTKGIPIVSCLHNFHFMEDNGINVAAYVTLDAGPITISEVSTGGKESPEHYWELTKNRTLVAFVGTDPELIRRWKGKIYWYNAPIPSKSYMETINAIESYNTYFSTGGNVLGSCLYLAKVVMGAGAVVFVGADFSFGYEENFHPWKDETYDKSKGYVIRATDIFNNRVCTWPSYNNFKVWFDWVAVNVPGIYINCTEGGTLGAYDTGNIMHIKVMDLKDCIEMYSMSEFIERQIVHPDWDGDLRIPKEEKDRTTELVGYNYVLY